jgi:ribosomal-protein-alanine N-acetyltransferase
MRWWDIEPVRELEVALFPEDGRLVGYGGLAAVGRTGDVQTIGVLPSHQGTGLGARLLEALLAASTAFECHEVLLEVRVDNLRAQRLYERYGFVPIGLRRGYYQPGDVDALVMRRDATSLLEDGTHGRQGTIAHG